MIRQAVHDDIPACVAMGLSFFVESGLSKETEFDPQSTAKTMRGLIENSDGLLLVATSGEEVVGMVAALAYPHYFNVNAKTSQELFWWVKPEHRGGTSGVRLLEAVEAWSKASGCKTLMMLDLPGVDSPASKIYQRKGYRPCERSFIKVV